MTSQHHTYGQGAAPGRARTQAAPDTGGAEHEDVRRLRAARIWGATGYSGVVLRVPTDWQGAARAFVNYHRDPGARLGQLTTNGVAVYQGVLLPEDGTGAAPVPVAVKEITVVPGYATLLDLAREAAGYITAAQTAAGARGVLAPVGLGLLLSEDADGTGDRLVVASPFMPLSVPRALALVGAPGALPPMKGVWGWALGLANAVAGLHHTGVVHGNVKPTNVFVNEGGVVVVSDFGHARLVAQCLQQQGDDGARQLGYRAYLAPEARRPQAASAGHHDALYAGSAVARATAVLDRPTQQQAAGACSFAADVWSLGAVLFELATRKQITSVDTAGLLDQRGGGANGGGVAVVRGYVAAVLADLSLPDAADRRRFLEFVAVACLDPDPQRRHTAASIAARLADPDTVDGAVAHVGHGAVLTPHRR